MRRVIVRRARRDHGGTDRVGACLSELLEVDVLDEEEAAMQPLRTGSGPGGCDRLGPLSLSMIAARHSSCSEELS